MSDASTDFVIRRLTMNDKKDVEHLMRLYLNDEPSTKHLQLTESEIDINMKPFTEFALGHGVSLGVFLKESGKMCGCCINSLAKTKWHFSDFIKENEMTDKLKLLIRLDEAIESGIAAATNNDNNFMKSEAAVILPEYKNRGLMGKLVAGIEEMAIEHNCDALVAVGTNAYSQKVVQKRSGYIPVNEILYKDYRDPVTGEAVFAGIPPPHTGAVLYVKKMKPEKSML